MLRFSRSVILFAAASTFSLGYADRKSPNTASGGGSQSPQGQYGSVRSYLTRNLRVDLEAYDYGEKFRSQLARMGVADDLQEHPEYSRPSTKRSSRSSRRRTWRAWFVGFTKPPIHTLWSLAKQGSESPYLIPQLAWMYSFGVMPDSLRTRLALDNPESPAARIGQDFFGRTNVILIDEILLSQQGPQRGAAASQEIRVKTVLADLFRTATEEYNSGAGNRTIFVFEELAGFEPYVHQALKRPMEDAGYQPRGRLSVHRIDPGYHILSLTTPDEYTQMLKGDSAIDGRYPTKVHVYEPTDEKTRDIVRSRAENDWFEAHYGIEIDESALSYMVHMKRRLSWPPLAAPRSVVNATEALFGWKTQHPGENPLLITLQDAQTFLQKNLGLSPLWFPGPRGEPPLENLANLVKELVVGHEEVIEKIAERITTWARVGGAQAPPVFFLGGPTGSGKDTIVMAFNYVLFGHTGHDLIMNMSGKRGFSVDAILEGPPLGNHSDGRPGLLQSAMDRGQGNGIIAFNEVYDMESAEFEKMKVLIERGELRPVGIDSRPRPLRYPIFFMGQFGEDLYENGPSQGVPLIDPSSLTYEEIDRLFTQGKPGTQGRIGAVPQALLDRAKKTGGVYLIDPVPKNRYRDIIKIWLKTLTAEIQATNRITLSVDKSLIDLMVETSFLTKLKVRGLYGIMSDMTEGAISRAIGQGLNPEGHEILLTAADSRAVYLKVTNSEWVAEFPIDELLRFQGSCHQQFSR